MRNITPGNINPGQEILPRTKRPEIQTRLDYLCQRYGVHKKTVWIWRQKIGIPTEREKGRERETFITAEEQIQLDHFFVACKASWGLQLPVSYYVSLLDEGKTIEDYLKGDYRYSCTLEQWIRYQKQDWFLAPEFELNLVNLEEENGK